MCSAPVYSSMGLWSVYIGRLPCVVLLSTVVWAYGWYILIGYHVQCPCLQQCGPTISLYWVDYHVQCPCLQQYGSMVSIYWQVTMCSAPVYSSVGLWSVYIGRLPCVVPLSTLVLAYGLCILVGYHVQCPCLLYHGSWNSIILISMCVQYIIGSMKLFTNTPFPYLSLKFIMFVNIVKHIQNNHYDTHVCIFHL